MTWAVMVVIAYLAGSIPFGLLIGKLRGVDIRKQGSGNIGATNVGRVLGRRFGMLCFGLDVAKGLAPSIAAGALAGVWGSTAISRVDAAWWLGVLTAGVAGHMFPVWLGFKGGKGVATGLGGCLGVHPFLSAPALCAAVVWVVVVKLTRFVGLASCLAAVSLPILVWVWHGLGLWGKVTGREVEGGDGAVVFLVGAIVLGGVVVFKHRGNIARMMRGEEPRVGAGKARPIDNNE